MTQHRLSIIIPTRNPQRCEHLIAQLRAYGHHDIIVVHPQSTVAPLGVQSITTPTLLSAAQARNLGAHAAQGSMLCFLDDDVILTSDVPTRLEWCFQAPHIVAAAGVLHDAPHNSYWQRCMHRTMTASQHWSSRTRIPTLLMSMALMVRRQSFWEVGGFDESFHGAAGEDAVLSLGLQRIGTLYILPQATLWHVPPQRHLSATLQRLWRYGYAWPQVLQRQTVLQSLLMRMPWWSAGGLFVIAPLLACFDMLRHRSWRREWRTIFGCWLCRVAWYWGVAMRLGKQAPC